MRYLDHLLQEAFQNEERRDGDSYYYCAGLVLDALQENGLLQLEFPFANQLLRLLVIGSPSGDMLFVERHEHGQWVEVSLLDAHKALKALLAEHDPGQEDA